MRSTTIAGLSFALLRQHPRLSLLAATALSVSFAAGFALAPRAAAPAPPVRGPEPTPLTPAGLVGTPGVVVVDHTLDLEGQRFPLRVGERVEVLARALHTAEAAEPHYLAAPLLVRAREHTRWVPGDVIALRDPEALGSSGWLEREQDLDGDGQTDRLTHVTRTRAHEDDEREERQGWLVFEGSAGTRLLELGYSSGWGTEERVQGVRLVDAAGGPAVDLVIVLDTSICEVGAGGHVVRVVTFEGGEPEVVLDHEVGDPVAGTGLAHYRVGRFELDFERGVHRAHTLVLEPPRAFDTPIPMRLVTESWTRDASGALVHRLESASVRTTDGRVIRALRGPEPGRDDPSGRRYLLDDGRWVERVRFADEHWQRAFDDYPTEAPPLDEWVSGLYAGL